MVVGENDPLAVLLFDEVLGLATEFVSPGKTNSVANPYF